MFLLPQAPLKAQTPEVLGFADALVVFDVLDGNPLLSPAQVLTTIAKCSGGSPVRWSAEDSARVQAALTADRATRSPGALFITVVPRGSMSTRCDLSDAAVRRVLAAGFSLFSATSMSAIDSLAVDNDGAAVPLGTPSRRPLTSLSNGVDSAPVLLLRVAVPLDSLRIDQSGEAAALRVAVSVSGSASANAGVLPGSAVLALWRQALPQRVAAADAETREAARLLGRGDGTRRETAIAAGRVATSLAHAGDDRGTRVAARVGLDAEPCVSLPPSAPPQALDAFARARRPARCSALPTRAVLLRGLIPGGAQSGSVLRTAFGGLVLAVTVERVLASQQAKRDARSLYDQHLRATSTPDALSSLERAERRRRQTDEFLTHAVAVWGLALAEGLVHEGRLAARLRHVRPITRAQLGGEIGLGLHISGGAR